MTRSGLNTSFPSRADRCLVLFTTMCAVVAGSLIVFVAAFVSVEAAPALFDVGVVRFFSDDGWFPTSDLFNLVPMLSGTLLTTAGALCLATPFGIASAVFSRFYAPPKLAVWYGRLVGLLAGIPSVVFGLWGLVVLVPFVAQLGGSGQSLLTAIFVLALMILPTVAITAEAALRAVPTSSLEGAAALGLGRWSTVKTVALPAAKGGIVAGLILATGRALGETMAVLMVAGNVVQVPGGFLEPVRTLTANIALEMGYATSGHRSVLFVSGLTLMAVVAALIAIVEWARRGREGGVHHA